MRNVATAMQKDMRKEHNHNHPRTNKTPRITADTTRFAQVLNDLRSSLLHSTLLTASAPQRAPTPPIATLV